MGIIDGEKLGPMTSPFPNENSVSLLSVLNFMYAYSFVCSFD